MTKNTKVSIDVELLAHAAIELIQLLKIETEAAKARKLGVLQNLITQKTDLRIYLETQKNLVANGQATVNANDEQKAKLTALFSELAEAINENYLALEKAIYFNQEVISAFVKFAKSKKKFFANYDEKGKALQLHEIAGSLAISQKI